MALTDAGRDLLAAAVVGEAATLLDEANSYIGVGDSDAIFAAAQTDLVGTRIRKPMETGYPARTANELVFRAIFDTSEANFAWEEWGVFNAPSGGTMLNRHLESLGTKPDTQSWQMTTTITLNNP